MPEEDKQRSRPAKKPQPRNVVPEPDEGVREIVALASEAVSAGVAEPRSAGPLTADPIAPEVQQANITDEAKDMGPVFGDFLKSVGLAVAETQEKLDETFRKTAEALSKQQIDVIAVFEQEIDDDGRMKAGKPHVQKLPLINYITPTIQEISHCSLSADMKVREFSSGNGFKIQGKTTSASAGVSGSWGMFGGGVRGHASFGHTSTEASGGSGYTEDTAAGSMHLEATIQPRESVKLPQPFVLQKGPALKLTLDSVKAIEVDVPPATEGGEKTKRRTGTKATITAELRGSNNGPLGGKKLELSVDQPTVARDFVKTDSGTTASSTTDKDGLVKLELTRTATDEWKPLETRVRMWLGLVSQDIVVAL